MCHIWRLGVEPASRPCTPFLGRTHYNLAPFWDEGETQKIEKACTNIPHVDELVAAARDAIASREANRERGVV
jgi:hypothetical protein